MKLVSAVAPETSGLGDEANDIVEDGVEFLPWEVERVPEQKAS